MKTIVRFRSVALIGAAIWLAVPAGAVYTNVTPSEIPGCDVINFEGAGVDELGTAPAFPADELISSSLLTPISNPACPSSALPFQTSAVVSITNLTPFTFTDLWYAADPETTITNVDGWINGIQAQGFKIDAEPGDLNTPLISDSTPDGLFEPLDTWIFKIDGYSNTLGLTAEKLGSIGVPSIGPGTNEILSSGSIIAIPYQVTPEPGTAALLGLGLLGFSLARRRAR
jgi:hypothetical protein